MIGCQQAVVSPSPENPTGGHVEVEATRAAPLGDTGRWLPLCEQHAAWWARTIPLGEVPEP